MNRKEKRNMDKEQAKVIARDIIRSMKSEYGIRTREQIEILDSLPKVIDALETERESGNSQDRPGIIRRILLRLAGRRYGRLDSDDMYTLDEEVMSQIAERVSDALSEMDAQNQEESDRQNRKIQELMTRLERSESLRKEFQEENENIRRNTAITLQNILSLRGGNENDPLMRELDRMMSKLGISAIFDSDSPEMFEVLKVENISAYRNKPCMMYNGQVLLHGTKFESVRGNE